MAAKPLYYGIEQVLQAYEDSASMYWSLYDKTAKLTQYNGEGSTADKAEGRNRLETLLKNFRNNGFDHDLNLHFHNKCEDAYEWKSKVTDQFIFNLFDPKEQRETMPATKGYSDSGNEKMMNFLISENQTLREKISQLEAQNILLQQQVEEYEAEAEEEEEAINGTGADQVTEILNNPVVVGLIDRIFPRQPAGNPVSHLSGTVTEADKKRLDQLLQILISKGVTIAHLEKLAAMPAGKIQNLLQWL